MENIDLPMGINKKIHYLSTHVKAIYNAEKAERYRKCVEDFDELAKDFQYDIYVDDESLSNTGIIRLVSKNILLHDEFIHEASVNLLSMLNSADEVIVERHNYNGSDSLVALTLKFYLCDLIESQC